MNADPSPAGDDSAEVCPPVRYGMLAFGWLNVGLGALGMVLPVMPTTVFLLIALWAFSKCSLRFHRWLYAHPILGRTLRDWHAHGLIPLKAKVAALATMTASLAYVSLFIAEGWETPAMLAAVLATVAVFIVSRPSRLAP